jgi:ABC-type dipeptide/oligopeptide/nickel transport system permease subunit
MAAESQALPARQELGPTIATRYLNNIKRFVRRQPMGAASAVVILVLALLAIFAPVLRTENPRAFGDAILESPSWAHWFGTNRDGNDMWSRVVYGARPSLAVGLAVVTVSVIGGTIVGLIAGYLGGWVDIVISRMFEVLNSIPAILFGLVIGVAMGPGLDAVVIAVSIAFMPAIGRILRGGVLAERNRQYVEAARVIGATEVRVMFRHMLPNLVPLMIVLASTSLPAAILTEAALSYLGVGLPIGDPSWGGDLGGTARSLFTLAPWLAIFPGIALSLTVLAFNLLGDSLRDELDPRLRNTNIGGGR